MPICDINLSLIVRKHFVWEKNIIMCQIVEGKVNLPTLVLWLLAYLLLEIFQEAIEDFQEVSNRLFVAPDHIFSCKHITMLRIILRTLQYYCY